MTHTCRQLKRFGGEDGTPFAIADQGDIRRDETVEVLPRDNRITVGGRVVSESSLRDGDRYKIYFEPLDRARVVKYRVVEEKRTR